MFNKRIIYKNPNRNLNIEMPCPICHKGLKLLEAKEHVDKHFFPRTEMEGSVLSEKIKSIMKK